MIKDKNHTKKRKNDETDKELKETTLDKLNLCCTDKNCVNYDIINEDKICISNNTKYENDESKNDDEKKENDYDNENEPLELLKQIKEFLEENETQYNNTRYGEECMETGEPAQMQIEDIHEHPDHNQMQREQPHHIICYNSYNGECGLRNSPNMTDNMNENENIDRGKSHLSHNTIHYIGERGLRSSPNRMNENK